MERADALRFVGSRQQGVLLTLRQNGRPQASNILYGIDKQGLIRISVTETRAKTKNLRRDPRCSLYVVGDNFWQYVVVDATAELSPPVRTPDDQVADELVDYYRFLRGEHPDWDEYRQSLVTEERVLLRLYPEYAYGLVRS